MKRSQTGRAAYWFYDSTEKIFPGTENYRLSGCRWLRMVKLGHDRDRGRERRAAIHFECCAFV